MAQSKYTRTAIALHWLLAILLATMIVLGLYMTGIPRNTPARGWFFNLHKSLGLIAAAAILLRVAWRLRLAPPPLAALAPRWQVTAAGASHMALYACMVLMPITGYVGSSFGKYGVKFFGLALPQWAWEDKTLQDFFVDAHHLLATAFIALILLHVAAALRHLARRDGVFARMWFGAAR